MGVVSFKRCIECLAILSIFLTKNLCGFDTPSNSNGCEDIDGGGWQLVRHVSPNDGTMHPATDNAMGSDVYGTFDNNAQSDLTWSIKFDDIEFNQYLFAFGDCSVYLITTTNEVYGETYSNSERCIIRSSIYPNEESMALWYNRDGVSEDPWISLKDHSQCRGVYGITDPCMVYGESSYASLANQAYGFIQNGGGNVWIRQKDNDLRCSNSVDCSLYTHKCTAFGDPHITTFDDTYYHYMGSGYYNYVKQCDSEIGYVPFTISALHETCNGENTCITEVIVTINDGSIISFSSNGNPIFKDTSLSATGNHLFSQGSYRILNYFFEIEWKDPNDEASIIRYLKFLYVDTSLKIETSGCLLGNLCGLCGYFNDNSNDDFTDCTDTNNVIDNADSDSWPITQNSWKRSHEFGDTCCNSNLNNQYLGIANCPSTDVINDVTIPNIVCTTIAELYCANKWYEYCSICIENDELDYNIWLEACAFDVCSFTNQDLTLVSEMEAFNLGCFDTSISKCEVDCIDESMYTNTNEPSNQPTEEPLSI